MDKQTIRDFSGKIIGFIETDSRGNKTVRDFYMRVLGYYDKSLDVTTDFYHRVIARGDCCGMLLNK